MWPWLRERGFKRSKATFHHRVESNWEVVNLQKSVYSDSGDVRFTVNLAVGWEPLREGVYSRPDGKRPPESRCQLRERLGLVAWGRDTWWPVDAGTDREALGREVCAALAEHGLPWLEARSSDAALRALDLEQELSHDRRWYEQRLAQLGER